MSIKLNKDKNIGKVLYIVEGSKTELYLLWKVFSKIFDYQVEAITRAAPYHVYNRKDNPFSKVFVINAAESNIKNIDKDDEYLNNLYKCLIEDYDFDIDNAAVFYLFDRDAESNTDSAFIRDLLEKLTNSRDNKNNYRQGLLLLSYPSVESFTLSCFDDKCFSIKIKTGSDLKAFLESNRYNQSKISSDMLGSAAEVMVDALVGINSGLMFDVDNFEECNIKVFDFEEAVYSSENLNNCLSLLCVSLIDLGLIEIE